MKNIKKKLDRKNKAKAWVTTVAEALTDCVLKKQWLQALQMFEMLKEQPFYQPKEATYMKLLVLLGRCGQPQRAHQIFDEMIEEGIEPTSEFYTALLAAYCRNNLIEEGFSIINQMKTVPRCQPDVYTYSTLLKACVDASRFELIDILYQEMDERLTSPNTVTQNIVLSGYGKVGMYDQMKRVLSGMLESTACKPDVWTMNIILSVFGNKVHVDLMDRWYEKFRNFGMEPETRTFNILIGAYGKKRITLLLLTSQQCEIFSGEWLKCSAQAFLFLIPGTIEAFVYWTGEYPLLPLGMQQTLVNCFSNPLSIYGHAHTYVANTEGWSIAAYPSMNSQMTSPVKIEYLQDIELTESGRSTVPSFHGVSMGNSDHYVSNGVVENDLQQRDTIERLPTFERITTALLDEVDDGKTGNKQADVKGKRIVNVAKLGDQDRHMLIEKLIKHIENDNLQLLQKLRERLDQVGVEFPTVEVRYRSLCVEAECEVVHGKPLPTLWSTAKGMLSGIANLSCLRQRAKISILKDVSGIIKPRRMTLLLGPPGCGKTTLLLALAGKLSHPLRLSGEVCYNGYGLGKFVPQKSSAYVSQYDLHIPEMTVRETIDFSACCQGIGNRAEILMEVIRREKQAGIHPDYDVDTYMKGISVEGLKSTLQTDYILKVISRKDQAQYWYCKEQPYSYFSIDEYVKKFKESEFGQKLDEELSKPFAKSESHKTALSFEKYSLPKWELFKVCSTREFLLMKRNYFIYVFKSVLLVFIASVTMTVLLRTRMAVDPIHANYYMGALFYALIILLVDGIPELLMTVSRLAVFNKQRELCFYPAWAYAIPAAILKVPLSFLEAFVWTTLTYYVIGYSPEVSRFFRQFLLFFLVHLTSTSMYRFIASIFQTVVASTLAGNLIVLIVLLFGGFLIQKPSMPAWLEWGFWFSPLTYGEIGLTVNEFLAPRWGKVVSANATIGQRILESRGLNFHSCFYWISVGALIGFTVLFNVGFTLALTFLKSPGKTRAIISYEMYNRLQGKIDGGVCVGKNKTPTGACSKSSTGPNKGRLVLPFELLTLTFKDVQYYVDTPLEMRKRGFLPNRLQLLSDITVCFESDKNRIQEPMPSESLIASRVLVMLGIIASHGFAAIRWYSCYIWFHKCIRSSKSVITIRESCLSYCSVMVVKASAIVLGQVPSI
ncbi:hypothetical protein D5086_016262 [Populus alba]|uniref:Uncharacterized protein n=1 Tax=Populus alba TaxID=43335 RepID=A0ACC4BTI7_POPAL